jgi:hypothetical protein
VPAMANTATPAKSTQCNQVSIFCLKYKFVHSRMIKFI